MLEITKYSKFHIYLATQKEVKRDIYCLENSNLT